MEDGAESPKKRRGRKKRGPEVVKTEVIVQMPQAPVAAPPQVPAAASREPSVGELLLLEELRAMQQIKLESCVERLNPEQRVVFENERNAKAVALWFATPYANKVPKTLLELSSVTGWSVQKLLVFKSMNRRLIEDTEREIESGIREYALLRFHEMVISLVDAGVKNGDTGRYLYVRELALGTSPNAPLRVEITPGATIDELIRQSREREQDMPTWAKPVEGERVG